MRSVAFAFVALASACAGKQAATEPTPTVSSDPGAASDGSPTRPEPPRPDPASGEGEACGSTTCQPPERCIEFPTMGADGAALGHECGITCDPAKDSADCPEGRRCIFIADGPGNVCS